MIGPNGIVIATGSHDVTNGLFPLEERKDSFAMAVSSKAVDSATWHRRMGHLNYSNLKMLKDGLASGITFNGI